MRFLLLTIIALLPTYLIRFHIGSFPTTLLEVLLLATFAFWIVQKIKTKNYSLPTTHYQLPILLFLLAATISIFISPNTRSALGLFKAYIVEPILFFIMFIDVARNWQTLWRDVTIALSLSALGVALPAIYQKWSPVGIPNIHWAAEATRRVTSWYGFPNAIGLYLAPLIPFFITQLFSSSLSSQERGRVRLIKCYWLLVTVVAVTAIVFARSEGALAALLAVGVTAGLLVKRTRVGTAIVALMFLTATLTNTPWRDYAYEQVTLRREAGPVRLMQWKEATAMLRDTSTPLGASRPLLGAGLAGYPTTIAPYHKAKHIEIYQYPHNIILNFWSEMGPLGLLAFLWLILAFYKQSIKKLPVTSYQLRVTLIAAMSVILIHGLVDVPYFKNDLAIFFWLLLALTTLEVSPAQSAPEGP